MNAGASDSNYNNNNNTSRINKNVDELGGVVEADKAINNIDIVC